MVADKVPRVLLVDDDAEIRSLYAAYLADDYEVVTAADGEEALRQFDGTVDVLLADRRMPEGSGADLVQSVRDRTDDCAIGHVTAVDPDQDGARPSVDAYLVKPVTRDELRTVVDRLCR